ncbi:hypothetical protein T552_02491 [Pneumocystis carinii B80]|uniref:Transcriptional regulatory protein RXT2 N-terminal domain-containing protein n=1 Tax=Pneumocystis carinii (strain B80) TaxID=1408658 RepID=A0A0W4ZF33_PNEC8|nr:hypothetical protein T552_02491 [Pneumocystis carinii B80]KTW26999.1 hypothetical protein T552_02491 [Pneumocystis carinii B80]
MKDEETLEELIRFKEALERSENGSDSSSSVNIYMGNRGCKLKRKARYAYRGKLGVPSSIITDRKKVYYGLKGRTVIQRKKHHRDRSIDTDTEMSTHSDDPYHDIDIDELLAPISHPAEFLRHRSCRKSLQSCLESLARQLLDTISEERTYNILLSKFLFILLGDDTSINMASHLNFQETKEIAEFSKDQTMNKTLSLETDISQPIPCQLPSFIEFPSNMNDTYLWCHQMGLSENDINDLRKLLQSALDRSMEYLRCLMQVRNGIIRAQRLMKKVYEWCVEASKRES